MRAAQGNSVPLYESHRNPRSFAWLSPIVVISLVLSGCGAPMVPVRGSVARDGKPLRGGKIEFTPIAQGQPAVGLIQPDGTFQLSTNRENDGAMAGQYRITVLGERAPEDLVPRMILSGPEEFTVDIRPGQDNEVAINIRDVDGWHTTQSD